MRRSLAGIAILAALLSGCVTDPSEPGECVYAEKPNPYGYAGDPIVMCVCPTGAAIPVQCQ